VERVEKQHWQRIWQQHTSACGAAFWFSAKAFQVRFESIHSTVHRCSDFSRPDLYDINDRLGLLPKTLCGSWRTIIIGDRVASNGTGSSFRAFFPKRVPLTVRVREYETCDMDSSRVWSKDSTRLAVTSYAIDESTLPTALQLDEWGRNLMLEYSEVTDFRPYVMDKFLFAYWNTNPFLRYVSLYSPLPPAKSSV
jgi:hypothetical protein